MLLALAGSDVAVSVAGSDDSYLRAIVGVAGMVGLGGTGAFVALLGRVPDVRRGRMDGARLDQAQYQAKQISDESVTVDAIWISVTVSHSVGLVFEHPLWALAGVVAFGAYKTCVRVGFSWLGGQHVRPERSPALLVLRSFSIGKDSERLFDVIDRTGGASEASR